MSVYSDYLNKDYTDLFTKMRESYIGIKKLKNPSGPIRLGVRSGKLYWVKLQTGEQFVGRPVAFREKFVRFSVIADNEPKPTLSTVASPLTRGSDSFSWEVEYHILPTAEVKVLRRKDIPLMVNYNKGSEFIRLMK